MGSVNKSVITRFASVPNVICCVVEGLIAFCIWKDDAHKLFTYYSLHLFYDRTVCFFSIIYATGRKVHKIKYRN